MHKTEESGYTPRSLVIGELQSKPILDDISIIIPTLGRPILEDSLYWIASGSAWPARLLVVDQGRSSGVAELLERLQQIGINATHIPSSQIGRASGVNRGLERVQTPFVTVTDDDCFVESDWLRNMYAALKDNSESIVTGRVEAAGEGAVITVTSMEPAVYRRPRLKFDTMSGGNMGTSMVVIKKVGLFDEDACLRTAEDGEWSYRALRAGIPILYRPQIVVRHFGWRESGDQGEQYKSYARSHGGFYGKYLRKGDWFILLRTTLHFYRALRRWVRGVITGDKDQAMIGRAYATGLLPGIIAGLSEKENGG